MELLNNLYKIHSMSGHEDAMRKFIKKYVRENIAGAVCTQKDGNIYIVKGESDTYPCIVAHTDQVQTKHSRDFKVFNHSGVLFGYSAENGRQEGLGADDKNGIWVALKCLERFDAIKVALFKEEEIGCGGSEIADMDFFKDVRFVLQADRRNGGDLITDICGPICSEEFLDDTFDIAQSHGYKETSGLMTDVETLSDRGVGVSCINFSCGYYKPHTDEEYTIFSELENCLDFAEEIIATCTKVYRFDREKRVYSYYPSLYSGYSKYDYSDIKDYNDSYRSGEYYEEVECVDFKDYKDPFDAIESFLWLNYDKGYSLEELWYYISADCETYGITYEDFCEYTFAE